MILNERFNPAIPMRIGMASLLIALLWPWLVHPTPTFGPDLLDGIQGFLFGFAIGMSLLWVVKKARRHNSEKV
jgi:hypothetical protein